MVQFIQGAEITTLEFLLRMRTRFRFILTSERWAERMHAESKVYLAIANHTGPVHVALFSIVPSMRTSGGSSEVICPLNFLWISIQIQRKFKGKPKEIQRKINMSSRENQRNVEGNSKEVQRQFKGSSQET